MSKLFRVVSTIMIAVGLAYLFLYTQCQDMNKLSILEQPSYYAVQSLWLMFLAGVVVIMFGVLGSYFSWFKKMDPEKEALPNAGYASDADIHTWLGGNTDDAAGADSLESKKEPPQQPDASDQATVVLAADTEVLPDKEKSVKASWDETEILNRGDEA